MENQIHWLLVFAVTIQLIGFYGHKHKKWNFKVYMYAFTLGAGFLFALWLLFIEAPEYSFVKKIVISASAVFLMIGVTRIIMRYIPLDENGRLN